MPEHPSDTLARPDDQLPSELLIPVMRHPVTTSVALILANVLPIIGVLFFGWNAPSILVLYWLENLIIGAFTVLRMATTPVRGGTSGCAKGILIPFFLMHYGLFCLVHGFFIVVVVSLLFKAQGGMLPIGLTPFDFWPMLGFLITRSGSLYPLAVAGLVISHGLSFGMNFIGRGEYRTANVGLLLFSPYGRVVILHLTLLFGIVMIAMTGIAHSWLAVMVLVKTAVDLQMHWRERLKAQQCRYHVHA